MSRASQLCPEGDFVHVARLGGYYDLKSYRRCDHLIGNTHDLVASFIAQGWPASRAHYLPNFVDAAPAPAAARDGLAPRDGVPLALALGGLHKNKGFDVLLAALAQVPALHLWLAGEGDLRTPLERQAAALGVAGRVRFLGWRDDAPALLAAADFLVCPSRHEPLGNVVIEAWAARRAVVAPSAARPRPLIADGDSGLLAPVEHVASLPPPMPPLTADPT